jgi:hypothetical protein
MDYERMTAPCGRDCFNCPFFLATTIEKLRLAFAEKLNLPPEKTGCAGCRSCNGNCEVLKNYGFNGRCKIFQCVTGKNHTFCFECPDFPCTLLHPLADGADRFPHNLKVYNLCRIRNIGLEKWASEEAKDSFNRYYTGNLRDCVG